jgi:hypothetical protein
MKTISLIVFCVTIAVASSYPLPRLVQPIFGQNSILTNHYPLNHVFYPLQVLDDQNTIADYPAESYWPSSTHVWPQYPSSIQKVYYVTDLNPNNGYQVQDLQQTISDEPEQDEQPVASETPAAAESETPAPEEPAETDEGDTTTSGAPAEPEPSGGISESEESDKGKRDTETSSEAPEVEEQEKEPESEADSSKPEADSGASDTENSEGSSEDHTGHSQPDTVPETPDA